MTFAPFKHRTRRIWVVVCIMMLGLAAFPIACSAPNHLGNPLTLPVRGLAAAIENANYDRKRAKVKAWIIENQAEMRAEDFDGPTTAALLETVPASQRRLALKDLKQAALYDDFAERATVIIMVLGP